MGTPPDIRTTFLFHPPVGDAASWQMTVEGFVHVLTTSFSEAFTKYRASHLRDKTVVDFEVEVGPGVWVEGVANTPVEGSAVITLVGVSASEAAQFALWLRTSMVPTPGLVRFSSERALEGGDATEWAVPSGGDLQQIVSVLEGHVARFHGH
ncbi:hypothetical protein [Streptomyces sp. ERV7]|uniref:hypothetical protein n=1 Tax=Streptomyces sp. ERV7 TaxID=1322334 RepID=UPI001F28638A|nr:hypothetical protein [Streptomyces sp. ERV7]